MTRPEILRRVLTLARDVFDEDDLHFDEATHFDAIEDWNSLTHVHMVAGMEKSFSIEFKLAELQRLEQVRDLIDIVERHLSARAAS